MLGKVYKFKSGQFILLTFAYVLFSVAVITAVTDRFVDKQTQQMKDVLRHELALIRYSIEANIFRDTYLADSFATVVAINPQFAISNWTLVAEQFLSKSNLVRNVGLAPNDIISLVYPLEGNEKAIGLDFRTVPDQYQTVLLAKNSKKVYIAGPLKLVQGGTALIARYPIFTDTPHNNDYWGGLSVVISYDKLLEKAKFFSVKDVELALVAEHYNGFNKKLLEGNESTTLDYDISYPIYLPNGSWHLFAKYKNLSESSSISGFKKLFISLGAVTFIIGYLFLLFLLKSYSHTKTLSLQDELTKLPNRRFLINELERIMSKSGEMVNFTILNIDLNKFKHINDTLGHEAGDEVLRHVASKLSKCLRSPDFVARMGGDEFVAILPRTTKNEDINKIIHKIHLALESSPLHWKQEKIWISLSAGFYVFQGEADQSLVKKILSEADKKMYENKMSRNINITYEI